MKKSALQRGFSLVELMVVTAIIAILAAIALPAYQDYIIRAEVQEAFDLSSNARTAVTDSYASTGMAPTNRVEAGLTASATDSTGKYVKAINVINGRIDITMGNSVNATVRDLVLSLTPYETADHSVVWRCGNADQPVGTQLMGTGTAQVTSYQSGSITSVGGGKYVPPTCRTGG